MSILNNIVKNAVDKKCAPSDEVIAKVSAWLGAGEPHYLEDFLTLAEPRDCIILMTIDKENDVDTEEKIGKIDSKVKHFIDVMKESGSFPEKIKVGYTLRTHEPSGLLGDYKIASIENNKIVTVEQDGSLILSDLVLVMDKQDRLSILRSKLHPSGMRMAWGKSLTHTLISKLKEHGVTTEFVASRGFSEKSGIQINRLMDILRGYVIDVTHEEYTLISHAIDVPLLDLIGTDTLTDIDLSPQIGK